MTTQHRRYKRPIRIFLANQPRMVRQMLRRAIQRIPNLAVVGESVRQQSIVDAPALMTIDWLVVSLTDQGKIPPAYLSLSQAHPEMKVMGISLDGNVLAVKDEVSGQKRNFRDVSLRTLIALFQDPFQTQPASP